MHNMTQKMEEYRRGECKRKDGIETAGIGKQKISNETNDAPCEMGGRREYLGRVQ